MGLRAAIAVIGALWALGAPTALAAPGDLDPSFGQYGVGPADSGAGDFVALDDGRILTLGTQGSGWSVRRFAPDGAPDLDFGDQGRAAIDSGIDARGIAVGPDGRITVVGQQWGTSPECRQCIRVFRFLANGQPDPSFGGDGQVTLALGTGLEAPEDVEVGIGGTTLIAGRVGEDQAVIGLDDAGEPDPAFGDGGVLALPEGTAVDIEPAPGGDYIVGGIQAHSPIVMFTRLTADGELVESYGTGGSRAVLGSGGSPGYPSGEMAVGPSGEVVFGSTIIQFVGKGAAIDPVLIALDPQGDVSSDFDREPALGIADRDKSQTIDGVTWDASGRLILTGSEIRQNYPHGGSSTAYIARLLPDGSLDADFGDGGGVGWFPADFSTFPAGHIAEPTVTNDGRILAQAGRLIRFLDGGEVANADADGLADDSDACPLRSSSRANGCARVRVSMRRVDAFAGEAFGRVSAPGACLRANKPGAEFRGLWVRLYAERAGPDPLIAKARVGKQGDWVFRDLSVGGPLYARTKARHHPGLVDCSSAVSRRVFPGR